MAFIETSHHGATGWWAVDGEELRADEPLISSRVLATFSTEPPGLTRVIAEASRLESNLTDPLTRSVAGHGSVPLRVVEWSGDRSDQGCLPKRRSSVTDKSFRRQRLQKPKRDDKFSHKIF